jgi:hypothetical protein
MWVLHWFTTEHTEFTHVPAAQCRQRKQRETLRALSVLCGENLLPHPFSRSNVEQEFSTEHKA